MRAGVFVCCRKPAGLLEGWRGTSAEAAQPGGHGSSGTEAGHPGVQTETSCKNHIKHTIKKDLCLFELILFEAQLSLKKSFVFFRHQVSGNFFDNVDFSILFWH